MPSQSKESNNPWGLKRVWNTGNSRAQIFLFYFIFQRGRLWQSRRKRAQITPHPPYTYTSFLKKKPIGHHKLWSATLFSHPNRYTSGSSITSLIPRFLPGGWWGLGGREIGTGTAPGCKDTVDWTSPLLSGDVFNNLNRAHF